MTDKERADAIRREIAQKVEEYYELALKPREYVPGSGRLSYAGRVFDAEEVAAAVDASLEFWLTYGHHADEFERDLAAYAGARHCLFVNSGSSANLLAFMALTSERLGERRIMRGDEVITTAAGFPTTVTPAVQFGAVPVFVDVTLPTADIDVSKLEEALSPRTKAVMIAHTLGNPFDVDAVKAFCEKHDLWLVEDNCDALGSVYKGRRTGTFGHVATCSFYPAHHMTTGEGGAVLTNDAKLHKIALALRDWGRDCICPPGVDDTCRQRFSRQYGELPFGYDHKYVYSEFGYNLKATDIQAAIGNVQLKKLPGFVEARRRNFALLHELLQPVSDVLELPEATEGSEPSWFGFLMAVRPESKVRREDIVAHVEGAGIQTRMLFGGNLVRQPLFDGMRARGEGYRVTGELTGTDRIMNDAFWVGVYPGLDEGAVRFMAKTIADAAGGAGR